MIHFSKKVTQTDEVRITLGQEERLRCEVLSVITRKRAGIYLLEESTDVSTVCTNLFEETK